MVPQLKPRAVSQAKGKLRLLSGMGCFGLLGMGTYPRWRLLRAHHLRALGARENPSCGQGGSSSAIIAGLKKIP
jgi:hypothetical protein